MNYESFGAPDGDVRFHFDTYQHDCVVNLEFREVDWQEPHGLEWGGQTCHDEWWECQVCGERFSEPELKKLEKAA